jgi:hypothetical protein
MIASEEGVCDKTVRNIARRRGVPRRRPDQRERDADVLEAFLAYVRSPRPLTQLRLSKDAAARAWHRSPALEARVFSAHMCRALALHGVVPRKTHTMCFSEQAASEPAVWLGMFDGDGSGGPHFAHGRPRLDWYGSRAVMEQCSAFWGSRLELATGRPPSLIAHAGGLTKVALYGSNAAAAARLLLDASPVSMHRKRRSLEQIAQYRPQGRFDTGHSTRPRRPTWQPQT